jgi:intracellular sulfur oxidation DsrE/DsrF family protein
VKGYASKNKIVTKTLQQTFPPAGKTYQMASISECPFLKQTDNQLNTMKNSLQSSSRRAFVGKLATAAAAGMASLQTSARATPMSLESDPESWIKNAKGSHRIVYDASEPHDGMAIIWSWVFYLTNNETGVADKDMTAMVVLRHNAIAFAMEDRLWKKYSLGEVFQVKDNLTQKPAIRNPYYVPQPGDFPAPGIEGIQKMQSRGAMFCVCDMALKVYSGMVASAQKLDQQEVYKDWVSGVLKDVQIVPSGVWAINRAQENRFTYCYAGG